MVHTMMNADLIMAEEFNGIICISEEIRIEMTQKSFRTLQKNVENLFLIEDKF
jgi:hypothetical protein